MKLMMIIVLFIFHLMKIIFFDAKTWYGDDYNNFYSYNVIIMEDYYTKKD